MPRKSTGRSANGVGSIRKKTITKNGKAYTYWESRYTAGYDPGTGKQIQRSITGKTQKEVSQKLKALTVDIDSGTYIAPNKQTLGEWLDSWVDSYLIDVKPRTLVIYKSDIKLHIKPAIGAVRLESLDAPTIQALYNKLRKPSKEYPKGLSAKTIKNVHGVLHKALQQAVLIGYLRHNPADACVLPRIEKAKIVPLDDEQITAFLTEIRGNRFETIFVVTLFSGMREGEILGLTWDCVDFERNTILIDKQIQLHQEDGIKAYELVSTKNGKSRSIVAPPTVMALLKRQKLVQAQQKLMAGSAWHNPDSLVFTDALGNHLTKPTVYREFKKVVAAIGGPDARFHDLRHSYAVAAIRSGDDIKTVQGNLGHATAAFTLDVYGHVTMQMKQESAARMEAYIKSVSAG
jgi:integrase